MVLPLIGSILAPSLLGSSALAAGLGTTLGLGTIGTGAALAGLGAGLGSLALAAVAGNSRINRD